MRLPHELDDALTGGLAALRVVGLSGDAAKLNVIEELHSAYLEAFHVLSWNARRVIDMEMRLAWLRLLANEIEQKGVLFWVRGAGLEYTNIESLRGRSAALALRLEILANGWTGEVKDLFSSDKVSLRKLALDVVPGSANDRRSDPETFFHVREQPQSWGMSLPDDVQDFKVGALLDPNRSVHTRAYRRFNEHWGEMSDWATPLARLLNREAVPGHIREMIERRLRRSGYRLNRTAEGWTAEQVI